MSRLLTMNPVHARPLNRRFVAARSGPMWSRGLRLGCLLLLLAMTGSARAVVYEVGPGRLLTETDQVPWHLLQPGDLVRIHWREQPYRSKWVIARAGTETQPILIQGVPGAGGARPLIDGENATTPSTLDYWNEARGVVKIGGASVPAGPARHLIIESLDIRGAHPDHQFLDHDGNPQRYTSNAASIHVEDGQHVILRDCVLRDSGNGLFVSSPSEAITLEHSQVHSNGIAGSQFQHNAYSEALGMLYQFNRFGPLRAGASGNNLKDRSAGLVVRYNWIEDGNRQLDLVDSSHFSSHPEYRTTLVYGNVLVEHDGQGNRQIVHYGGDGGNQDDYRKGDLYFYHNTVVSERSGRATLFRLSSNDEHADIRANVFFHAGPAGSLELATTAGEHEFRDNWLSGGFVHTFDSGFTGSVALLGGLIGRDPGFSDRSSQDYRPRSDSVLAARGSPLAPAVSAEHQPVQGYVMHAGAETRQDGQARAWGALAARPPEVATPAVPALSVPVGLGLALSLLILACGSVRPG
ncbi:MAG: polysaccharide-degrading enzyme [Gammaproteobacteria bacterium]|nr:polysaccharide-degrading enzyme [Gammaproteobacteria bacterium]